MYFVLCVADGIIPAWRATASYTDPRTFVKQDYGTAVTHVCAFPSHERYMASCWLACAGAFRLSKFGSVWAPFGCDVDRTHLPRDDCDLRSSGRVELASTRQLRRVRPRLHDDCAHTARDDVDAHVAQ